jgi:predicted glycosyltransferase
MNVWIDLANAPDVPFFVPVVSALERGERGCVFTDRVSAERLTAQAHWLPLAV